MGTYVNHVPMTPERLREWGRVFELQKEAGVLDSIFRFGAKAGGGFRGVAGKIGSKIGGLFGAKAASAMLPGAAASGLEHSVATAAAGVRKPLPPEVLQRLRNPKPGAASPSGAKAATSGPAPVKTTAQQQQASSELSETMKAMDDASLKRQPKAFQPKPKPKPGPASTPEAPLVPGPTALESAGAAHLEPGPGFIKPPVVPKPQGNWARRALDRSGGYKAPGAVERLNAQKLLEQETRQGKQVIRNRVAETKVADLKHQQDALLQQKQNVEELAKQKDALKELKKTPKTPDATHDFSKFKTPEEIAKIQAEKVAKGAGTAGAEAGAKGAETGAKGAEGATGAGAGAGTTKTPLWDSKKSWGDNFTNMGKTSPNQAWEWAKQNKVPLGIGAGALFVGSRIVGGGGGRRRDGTSVAVA